MVLLRTGSEDSILLFFSSWNDELLPSREEAERLRDALEKCRIRNFKDNGHKILLV